LAGGDNPRADICPLSTQKRPSGSDLKADVDAVAIGHHTGRMIDRAARDVAAHLTRQFRDGLLTNDDLEDQWPDRSEDRALKAMASMLWRYYDDNRVHTLSNPNRETVAELTRYAAFLDTDLPYEWSEDRFDRIDWIGIADRLTLGRVRALANILRSRARRLEAEGDVAVWPFVRAADIPPIDVG